MQDQGQDVPETEAGDVRQFRTSIWLERALCLLILATLAGTLNLIIAIHRRVRSDQQFELRPEPLAAVAVQPKTAESTKPVPAPVAPQTTASKKSPRPVQVVKPPEDPTKKALDELSVATAREVEAAKEADRGAQAHERARKVAIAESERWQRREMLVTQQVASLSERVHKIDQDIDKLAAQRDVLARERDALKAAVTKAQQGEGSYAVLPYKGPNGSWRRPIVLECSKEGVSIRPKGPTFSLIDLSSILNPRSSPVIVAIARELLRVQRSESPDGAPVVPYFVFLVRPDGVRPYYELRARLEPLGIAFGYELIEQDLKVDVPDFDDLSTWDGTIPLEVPGADPAKQGLAGADAQDGLSWPGAKPVLGGDRLSGRGAIGTGPGRPSIASSDDDPDSPDAFVWPSRPPGQPSRGMPGQGGDTPARVSARRGSGDGATEFGLLPAPRGNDTFGPSARGGLNFAMEDARERSGRIGPGHTGRAEKPHAVSTGIGESPDGHNGREGGGPVAGAGKPGNSAEDGSAGSRGPSPISLGAHGSRPSEGVGPFQGVRPIDGIPDLEPAEPGPTASALNPDNQRGPGTGAEPGMGVAAAPAESGTATPGGSLGGTGLPSVGRESRGSPPMLPSGSEGLPRSLQVNPSQVADGSQPPLGTLGLGLGSLMGAGEASNAAGGSGMVLGSDSSSTPKAEKSEDSIGGAKIGSRIPDGPARKIDVPFEIVVVCQPEGLVIHPGGYRITRAAFERNKKDGVLVQELLAVARQRAAADPNIRPQPRVKFLVEGGGGTTYWNARKQILFSGLGWPMSLQVTGAQDSPSLGQETWQ